MIRTSVSLENSFGRFRSVYRPQSFLQRVTVTDFHHADGDKIDLSNLNFGAGVTDTELQALVTAAPDPHTLDLGNGQVLTVSNVAVSTLQSSDFILHH